VPFLRVIRDKRGYETTYLMHWFQEHGRQRSRILYAFRSPSGARVGRDAIDPGLMRQIEGLNPAIAFDWKAILADRQVIEPSMEPRRRKPKRAGDDPTPEERPSAPAPATVAPAPTVEPSPQPPRPAVPSAIEGATDDERVAFLRHWYPLVRERVERRASDAERQAALISLTERMNPSDWPAEEVVSRLSQAGEALERLSHVFARRRRRTRRKPDGPAGSAQATEPSSSS
jgi:hypothetical protein